MDLKRIWLLLIILSAVSCKKTPSCELSDEILQVPLEVSIKRMENELFIADSKKEITRVLEQHPEFTQQYLQENLYESREELAAELLRVNQDTSMQELYSEIVNHFNDVSAIEKELQDAFKYVRYHFPEFKVPK